MDNNNETAGNRSNDAPNQFDIASFEPYEEAASVISFVLFTIIVCLNGLVIYMLVCRKQKKSRLLYFVLHLALADLLVGICSALGDGINSAMHNEWYGGDFLCRLYRFMAPVTLMASNNILIGMSVDRFLAIKYPLNIIRIGFFRHLDKILVFGAWLISVVAASIYIPYSRGVNAKPDATDLFERKGGCFFKLPPGWWKPYGIITAMAIFLLPTICITVCYVGICIIIWRKWRSRTKLSEIDTNASSDRLQGNKPPSHDGLLSKAKIKSIKMTTVVCFAFFICWTPYFIVILLSIFEGPGAVNPKTFIIFTCLYPLNSACNPLIFIFFNRKMFSCRQNDQQSVPLNEETQDTTT